MRTACCFTILLFALPALAADAKPDAPPSPSPVAYDVWGFKWDGRQYVKQATHSFSTTDIKQATDVRHPGRQLRRLGGDNELARRVRCPHRIPRSRRQHRTADCLPR